MGIKLNHLNICNFQANNYLKEHQFQLYLCGLQKDNVPYGGGTFEHTSRLKSLNPSSNKASPQ